MRLQRLTHKTVEPDDAGALVGIHRRGEGNDDAAAAVGGDAHKGFGREAKLLHQRRVEPHRQPRAVAEFIRQMIDSRMHMGKAPMAMAAVRMAYVIHYFFALCSGAASITSKP